MPEHQNKCKGKRGELTKINAYLQYHLYLCLISGHRPTGELLNVTPVSSLFKMSITRNRISQGWAYVSVDKVFTR